MSETTASQMRMERIERLLRELEYDVTRGILGREIDEEIGFRFLVPNSRKIPNGLVFCEFRTRPTPPYEAASYLYEPLKLRIVGGSNV